MKYTLNIKRYRITKISRYPKTSVGGSTSGYGRALSLFGGSRRPGGSGECELREKVRERFPNGVGLRALTIDEYVLPPDVVLAPAVVVLHMTVLQLWQGRQWWRRRGRQKLWRRRRRAEGLNWLRVLVLHGEVEALTTRSHTIHTSRRGSSYALKALQERACERGGVRRANRLAAVRHLRLPLPSPPHHHYHYHLIVTGFRRFLTAWHSF
ncbi:unnamed protein product [Parnassius apollo]|uniref:(apollo) hypothetical protein n=1 Tax=Parnassius apollo TaxID=110799 RepID=A0A8S3WV83_PARAO|nr:unnamed protein product [Parnassius apollo]